MKRVFLATLAGVVALPALFAGELQTVNLTVKGMMCSACSQKITIALKEIQGVETVEADAEAGSAKVTASPQVSSDQLVAAVKKAGYETAAN
jgi:copper chaperone CopZ